MMFFLDVALNLGMVQSDVERHAFADLAEIPSEITEGLSAFQHFHVSKSLHL